MRAAAVAVAVALAGAMSEPIHGAMAGPLPGAMSGSLVDPSFGSLAVGRVAAQGAQLSATVEAVPASATVGDRIAFHVRVTRPSDTTIVWPAIKGRWGAFEVVGVGERTTGAGDPVGDPDASGVVEERVITATAFTTGTLQSPAIELRAVDRRGATEIVVAAPAAVVIRSVLGPNDSAPRGPRGPVELPMPSRWPLVAGALSVVAALLTLLFWALRRLLANRAREAPAAESVPDFRTPLDLAVADLDALEAANLPARGRITEHYTRLADTLRLFVERAYFLPALERTTPELAAAFGRPGERDTAVESLLALLADADLVKFARIVPDAAIARASSADARAMLGGLWSAAERRRIAAEAAAARAGRSYGHDTLAAADDTADGDAVEGDVGGDAAAGDAAAGDVGAAHSDDEAAA